MIDHSTGGSMTTGVGTRVDALVVEASLVAFTVRVRDAFGSAARVRVTNVLW